MATKSQPVNSGAGAGSEAGLSLAERAYRTLRDELVMLEIPPGSAINDDALAARLGFGRTPVREALKRLEYEHLIVAFPRRGTFATEVNITDLGHISEVRKQLEPPAIAQAAARASAAERDTLTRLAAQLGEPALHDDASTTLMRLDLQVHRTLYGCVHNPYLENTLVGYDNLATRIWSLFLGRLAGMAGHVAEHGPLLQAVIEGEAELARKLSAEHIDGFERAVHDAM